MKDEANSEQKDDVNFLRRLGFILLIAVGAAVLYVTEVAWLIVFASLLFAIILHLVAEVFRRYLRMPFHLGLAVSVLLFATLFGGVGVVMFPLLRTEIGRAIEEVPKMLEDFSDTEVGGEIFSEENKDMVMQGLSNLLAPIATTVNWAIQLGGFVILVVVLGVFFAHQPRFYRDGVVRAFPMKIRPEVRRLLDNCGVALGLWLLGQAFAMAVVGALTTVLLLIFGMPYPFTLGLLAGLFQFIPLLGPLFWALPATTLAAGHGLSSAITVLAIYMAVQLFESNVLTPVIQHKAVSLPPVLTLLATLLLGMLFGVLGFVLGTPLAVVAMVTYDQLYLRNTLGDTEIEVPGEGAKAADGRQTALFSRLLARIVSRGSSSQPDEN